MKLIRILSLVFLLPVFLQTNGQEVTVNEKDRSIVEKIIHEFKDADKSDPGKLLKDIALTFLETPYVAHTLETGPEEKMVINLRELDCTTFADNCLALVHTLLSDQPTFNTFSRELERIRYRDGVRSGYISRLHYFSEWIDNNVQKGYVMDVAKAVGAPLLTTSVGFMGDHPASYPVLKAHPELVPELKRLEQEVTTTNRWYIPLEDLDKFEVSIKDGDIIGITTSVKGLDVTHVVIASRESYGLSFIHASSLAEKVILDSITLQEYLQKGKSNTGIMVVRPLIK